MNPAVERDAVARVYDWRHAQAAEGATRAFAASGAILTPLLAAVFDATARVETVDVVLFLAGAALSGLGGFLYRIRAASLQRRYLHAVGVSDPERPLSW